MYSANGGPKTMQLQLRRGRYSASSAASSGHREPARKPNKVWLVVVMTLLVAAMALQSLAVATPSWVRVGCHQGAVTVGLWMTCGHPLVNITSPLRTPEISVQLNSTLKVESRKRSVDTTESSEEPTERKPVSFLFWDDCIKVFPDVDHSYPVWFEATQLLESMGLGCTAITTLLLTLYACAPTFMALQVALGFAAASFTSGGFIIVGMFNISGGRRGVSAVLPQGVVCDADTSTLHVSFKLSSVAVSLLGVAGVVATLASILEKGDAPQNRNRKGEEAACGAGVTGVAGGTDSVAITPPASPSPPSTISDNESTPLSFDSVYESDCPYPCEHKNTSSSSSSKKKVSFQNRRGGNASQPASLSNSVSAGVPVCTIPASQSVPHGLLLHQPVPRRLSAASVAGPPVGHHHHHLPHAATMRRQSSPLRYLHQGAPPPGNPMTWRQDSVSSRGSADYGTRRMSPEEKAFVQMTSPSRNSTSHYRDNYSHSRRSSRT